MYLVHAGKTAISDKVNDYPPFVFPPGEPVEIKDDFIAQKVMEHRRLEGLVEVKLVGGKVGNPFDLAPALAKAKKALASGRREMVETYIKTQREGRIRQNLPPLPPSPVVQKIIEEDGVDLRAEGINLSGAGFAVAEKTQAMEKEIAELQVNFAALREQNQLLIEQNKLLKTKDK